ncbi:RNA-binding protein 25 [Entomortierella parvispora]|uniref:RNA-binding protein 25 n=1 Tax=Entomortierella parvispora TaxID=205924 RepID=A0A9P3LZF8_9FUNG|nr:RNA-binding protein 25 [Entomortierella parvispora]
MDPYRQQYPPYQGQPPQQQGPPPHLRHGAPPPGHYGPPPPHMAGHPPPHMPMYPGGPPPGPAQPPYQQYPPHMPYPGAPLPQPHHQQPYPMQHHQQPPYGGMPPQHQRMPPPRAGPPGYGPPGGPPGGLMPPGAMGSAPPPLSIGGPAGYVPTPPPSAQGLKPAAAPGATVVGGALPDKMNTLFIGSIAPGINNVVMEKLLKTTGELVRWKRVQDPTTQQWKAFGFAEYADADSLLRTLRVLGQDGKQPKGEKPVGLELQAMDGSGIVKALLVKADEKTRQFLDQYDESRPSTILDSEKDKTALANAMKIIQQMKDGTLDMTTESESDAKDEKAKDDSNASSAEPNYPHSHQFKLSTSTAGDGEELPEEQKELIARELLFFRERAAIKEKEKKEEEEKAERLRNSQQHKQLQREQREREREREREKESSNAAPTVAQRMGRERAWGSGPRQVDFVASSASATAESSSSTAAAPKGSDDAAAATTTSMEVDTGMDSEEEERSRQERRDRELEQSYRERERRWEQREAERSRLYEKDRIRDEEYTAGMQAAKEAIGHRFAQWDDEVERERRHEDYYRDRSRWWTKRQAFLQKEQRYDDLDREEEKEELAQEAARQAAAGGETEKSAPSQDQDTEMTDASNGGSSTPTVDASTILPDRPTGLKLSLGTANAIASLKRGSDANGANGGSGTPNSATGSGFAVANEFEQDEDDGKEVKKRRLFIPGQSSDSPMTSTATGTMTAEEKEKMEQAAKALIQSIPSDAAGLWSWPIQWKYVFEDKESILTEKIQPFTARKVMELLGVQEDELTNYVVEHIRKKLAPQALVDELRSALDSDADVLVMKVWRMLIFETESKARKISK